MAFDAVCMYYSALQMKNMLTGARVDKIHQLSGDEVVLHFNAPGVNEQVFLSARANSARAHITHQTFENPQKPPMFCMLLRKHLLGGRLLDIRQPDSERILFFDFECTNELRDRVKLTLVVETMGRHSNLILVNQEGKIIDSVKRVDFTMSSVRQVLPGMIYSAPPAVQSKKSLFLHTAGEICQAVAAAFDGDLVNAVKKTVGGISPIVAGEIAHAANGGALAGELDDEAQEKLLFFVSDLQSKMKAGICTPTILLDDKGAPKDLCFMEVRQYGHPFVTKTYESVSTMLDTYFTAKDAYFRVRSRSEDLFKSLMQKIERITRKQEAQKKELAESENREIYKVYGDLLNTYLYMVQKGDRSVTLQNYYDENCAEVTIPLNMRLTPAQNAQNYYKKYKKLTTAHGLLQKMIQDEGEEITYLESVFDSLSRAQGEEDILAIREELAQTGYLKKAKTKQQKMRKKEPYTYILDDGYVVQVGRNNLQNDALTFKTAGRWDIWFHTTDIPGSHVILFTNGDDFDAVPELAFTQAATIAATHSQGGEGQSRIRVDYTLIKNVKKPPAAEPGMVIFHQNYSAYVTPDKELCQKLLKK